MHEEFGDDIVMESAAENCVKSWLVLDPHYTYTSPSQDDRDDEIDEYMNVGDIENETVSQHFFNEC